MSTERELTQAALDQCRADKEAIADKERGLEQEIKDMEVTYSAGDRFKASCDKYILTGLADNNKVNLVNLRTGNSCNGVLRVGVLSSITPEELGHLYGCIRMTRYWDARKGCKV